MRNVTSIKQACVRKGTPLVAAVMILMASLLSTNAFAAKRSGTTCTGGFTPVTSFVADFDGTSTPYSVQSDGLGAYDNSQTNVCSDIWSSNTSGGWELDVTSSTSRTFKITLSNPVPTSSYTIPSWSGSNVVAKIEDKCYLAAHDPGKMRAGDQFLCPLVILQIPSGTSGDVYGLSLTGQYAAAPETGLVQFSCNFNGSDGVCNDWFIDPVTIDSLGNVNVGTAVARLVETVSTRKLTNQYPRGDFYLTFHLHVTRP